ncbi:MAG: alpha-ketoacid dehydrogenase subunit beta [Bdellovibrionales bacterium]|nr:alpha-ketoacid dehydrogenase subunit beta [Bdellovibrionales bacterium]
MANMAQAIRMALHYGEKHLQLKDVFGQDVGPPLGGVFTVTQGLKTAWNTPLDERGIIGTAIGIALTGERCVAEVQFADYIFNTIDLLKLAGNCLWSSHGQYALPFVLMTPTGAGIHGAIYHSHSFESWASRLPGWKIVMPSDPLSAYGLMLSAIEDPNPVLYLKPKALLRVKGNEKIPGEPEQEKQLREMIDAPLGDRQGWEPRWPLLKEYKIPIGKGRVVQSGSLVTVVSFGRSLFLCHKALEQMEAQEREGVELIDMRSIYPYDWSLIKKSILKTKRVLFVNEDTEVTNFGEHLAYRASRECFYHLYSAPRVLAGKNLPGIGLHPNLEKATVPQETDILSVIRELKKENP